MNINFKEDNHFKVQGVPGEDDQLLVVANMMNDIDELDDEDFPGARKDPEIVTDAVLRSEVMQGCMFFRYDEEKNRPTNRSCIF